MRSFPQSKKIRVPHKTCFAPFCPTIEIVGYFYKAPMHRDFRSGVLDTAFDSVAALPL